MVWPIVAAAAPYVAAAIGGAASYLGGKKANESNKQSAREQMAFQERMSNTAYQRAANDMQAAGLNRILAAGSPASSPGGAGFASENTGAAGVQGAAAGMSSAKAASEIGVQATQKQLIASQNQNTQQNTELQNAQTAKTREETRLTAARATKEERFAPVNEKVGDLVDKAASKAGDVSEALGALFTDDKFRGELVDDMMNKLGSSAREAQTYLDNIKKQGLDKGAELLKQLQNALKAPKRPQRKE